MHFTIPVRLEETASLHQRVRQFCARHGIPEDDLFVVILSIDELVTNIVTHGTKGDPTAREIVLLLAVGEGRVRAEIEDDGCAFNPLDEPEPDLGAGIHERPPGGLGIVLVRRLMDEIEYSRIGQRNRLTLTKFCH